MTGGEENPGLGRKRDLSFCIEREVSKHNLREKNIQNPAMEMWSVL